jgi:DNA-binding response OmpR family regulator
MASIRRKLLVVEDDRTLRQALVFNLSREGYEPVTAADGENALAIARAQRLDLILLDVMLPGMSGVEVLRTLRREGIDTPVIIIRCALSQVTRPRAPAGLSGRARATRLHAGLLAGNTVRFASCLP